jgi:hypothetical protein
MAKKPTRRETMTTSHVVHGSIGGDLVGGNKTVTQTAGGDIVGGNKITTTTTQTQSLDQAFRQIHQKVEARPPDPNVEKDEIQDAVKRIEVETRKGEAANPDRLERLLLTLGGMADDIFQVVTATLANPALGIAKTIQLIAQKAKEERAKQAGANAAGVD